MDYVTIDAFKKIHMRVGRIIEVLDHPKADKLYILRVNMGNEIRTLVAGIKPWYKKEELKGKTIVVLVNLQPKEIRGVKSEGMLLAADDGKTVSILTVDKEVELGARIS